MAEKKKERGEVWLLAHGHSSHSRQPSFAPPTARPVVSHSSYSFGWNRKKLCFITTKAYEMFSPVTTKDYPCDPEVAQGILRRCAYKNVLNRFFNTPYTKEDDADIYATAGHMFGISLSKRHWGKNYRKDAEACLHFYAPDYTRQFISFHDGMTRSFSCAMSGMKISDIHQHMQ